jgi:hypothetical protein
MSGRIPPSPNPVSAGSAAHGPRRGYFGFLDALGIRGRWQSEPPEQIVEDYESWYAIVTSKDSASGVGTLDGIPEVFIPAATGKPPKGFRTQLWAFSDTIAFSLDTRGESDQQLTIRVGNALAEIFVSALQKKFLLRGSVAFGDYFLGRDGRILVGPAVDEAASWHEQADWAGIILTPSAGRTVIPDAVPGVISQFGALFMSYDVPMKTGGRSRLWALNWPLLNRDEILSMVDRHFMRPPVTPEVERKRANTLDFFAASRAHEQEIRRAHGRP